MDHSKMTHEEKHPPLPSWKGEKFAHAAKLYGEVAHKLYEDYSYHGVEAFKKLIEISERNRAKIGHSGYTEAVKEFMNDMVNGDLHLDDDEKQKIITELQNKVLL